MQSLQAGARETQEVAWAEIHVLTARLIDQWVTLVVFGVASTCSKPGAIYDARLPFALFDLNLLPGLIQEASAGWPVLWPREPFGAGRIQ
jgi:hypothetical protein